MSFLWRTDEPGSKRTPGFVAQNVQSLFPHMVLEDDDGFLSIKYSALVALLVHIVQEQHSELVAVQSALNHTRSILSGPLRRFTAPMADVASDSGTLEKRNRAFSFSLTITFMVLLLGANSCALFLVWLRIERLESCNNSVTGCSGVGKRTKHEGDVGIQ